TRPCDPAQRPRGAERLRRSPAAHVRHAAGDRPRVGQRPRRGRDDDPASGHEGDPRGGGRVDAEDREARPRGIPAGAVRDAEAAPQEARDVLQRLRGPGQRELLLLPRPAAAAEGAARLPLPPRDRGSRTLRGARAPRAQKGRRTPGVRRDPRPSRGVSPRPDDVPLPGGSDRAAGPWGRPLFFLRMQRNPPAPLASCLHSCRGGGCAVLRPNASLRHSRGKAPLLGHARLRDDRRGAGRAGRGGGRGAPLPRGGGRRHATAGRHRGRAVLGRKRRPLELARRALRHRAAREEAAREEMKTAGPWARPQGTEDPRPQRGRKPPPPGRPPRKPPPPGRRSRSKWRGRSSRPPSPSPATTAAVRPRRSISAALSSGVSAWRRESLIFPFTGSIAMILTLTLSPIFTTSVVSRTRPGASSEMWTSPSMPGRICTKQPYGSMRMTVPRYSVPLSGTVVSWRIASMHFAAVPRSLEATVTVPSSCTSILQAYSFWSARIVLPPEPMTSRIFSSGTVIVSRRGANAESSGRAAFSVCSILSRMKSRPWRACSSACWKICGVMPPILMSIWRAVMPVRVPATLKSMSP